MSLIPIDEVVHFDVITSDPTNEGAAVDADSAPTYDVFEENTDTPILDDQSMTKRTSLTGNYRGSFTASAANGFEAGKWYSVIATAVVGGVTGKCVAKHFRISPAESSAGVPKVDASHWGGTAVASANVLIDGAITAAKIATDAITSAKVEDGFLTDIADAVWDEALSGHTTSGSAGERMGRIPNAAAAGTGGLPTVDANNRIVGIQGTITTLDALDTAQDTQHANTLTRLGSPAGASVSADIADVESKVDDLESRLTAQRAANLDNLDAAISTRASQTSVTTIDDLLDTEVQAIITSIAALNNISTSDVLTQVNAALQATLADSIPADGTRPSISSGIYMLVQFMLERSVSGTTCTVRKPDGSTTLFSLTLNDGSAPTSITRSA